MERIVAPVDNFYFSKIADMRLYKTIQSSLAVQ